jgi:hypothetical protein
MNLRPYEIDEPKPATGQRRDAAYDHRPGSSDKTGQAILRKQLKPIVVPPVRRQFGHAGRGSASLQGDSLSWQEIKSRYCGFEDTSVTSNPL